MNFNMFIPVIIVVMSNTLYHVCAKSTPAGLNTFASLTITYLVGAIASLAMYFITVRDGNLLAEYRQLNWTSFALGLAIVGLEAGFIGMYKIGWDISIAQIVPSALLAIVLLLVGILFFKEMITLPKLAGIVICLIGIYLIKKG